MGTGPYGEGVPGGIQGDSKFPIYLLANSAPVVINTEHNATRALLGTIVACCLLQRAPRYRCDVVWWRVV